MGHHQRLKYRTAASKLSVPSVLTLSCSCYTRDVLFQAFLPFFVLRVYSTLIGINNMNCYIYSDTCIQIVNKSRLYVILTLKGRVGHIGPTVLHRNCTGPAQALYRTCTGPAQGLHGPCTGPVRFCTNLHRCLGPTSVKFRKFPNVLT